MTANRFRSESASLEPPLAPSIAPSSLRPPGGPDPERFNILKKQVTPRQDVSDLVKRDPPR
jgi:hypothetical protein